MLAGKAAVNSSNDSAWILAYVVASLNLASTLVPAHSVSIAAQQSRTTTYLDSIFSASSEHSNAHQAYHDESPGPISRVLMAMGLMCAQPRSMPSPSVLAEKGR